MSQEYQKEIQIGETGQIMEVITVAPLIVKNFLENTDPGFYLVYYNLRTKNYLFVYKDTLGEIQNSKINAPLAKNLHMKIEELEKQGKLKSPVTKIMLEPWQKKEELVDLDLSDSKAFKPVEMLKEINLVEETKFGKKIAVISNIEPEKLKIFLQSAKPKNFLVYCKQATKEYFFIYKDNENNIQAVQLADPIAENVSKQLKALGENISSLLKNEDLQEWLGTHKEEKKEVKSGPLSAIPVTVETSVLEKLQRELHALDAKSMHKPTVRYKEEQGKSPIRVVLTQTADQPSIYGLLFSALQCLTGLDHTCQDKLAFSSEKQGNNTRYYVDILDPATIEDFKRQTAFLKTILDNYKKILDQLPTASLQLNLGSSSIYLTFSISNSSHQDNRRLYDALLVSNTFQDIVVLESPTSIDDYSFKMSFSFIQSRALPAIEKCLQNINTAMQQVVCPPLTITTKPLIGSPIITTLNITDWEKQLKGKLFDPGLRLVRVPGHKDGGIRLLIVEPSVAKHVISMLAKLGNGVKKIDEYQIYIPLSMLTSFKEACEHASIVPDIKKSQQGAVSGSVLSALQKKWQPLFKIPPVVEAALPDGEASYALVKLEKGEAIYFRQVMQDISGFKRQGDGEFLIPLASLSKVEMLVEKAYPPIVIDKEILTIKEIENNLRKFTGDFSLSVQRQMAIDGNPQFIIIVGPDTVQSLISFLEVDPKEKKSEQQQVVLLTLDTLPHVYKQVKSLKISKQLKTIYEKKDIKKAKESIDIIVDNMPKISDKPKNVLETDAKTDKFVLKMSEQDLSTLIALQTALSKDPIDQQAIKNSRERFARVILKAKVQQKAGDKNITLELMEGLMVMLYNHPLEIKPESAPRKAKEYKSKISSSPATTGTSTPDKEKEKSSGEKEDKKTSGIKPSFIRKEPGILICEFSSPSECKQALQLFKPQTLHDGIRKKGIVAEPWRSDKQAKNPMIDEYNPCCLRFVTYQTGEKNLETAIPLSPQTRDIMVGWFNAPLGASTKHFDFQIEKLYGDGVFKTYDPNEAGQSNPTAKIQAGNIYLLPHPLWDQSGTFVDTRHGKLVETHYVSPRELGFAPNMVKLTLTSSSFFKWDITDETPEAQKKRELEDQKKVTKALQHINTNIDFYKAVFDLDNPTPYQVWAEKNSSLVIPFSENMKNALLKLEDYKKNYQKNYGKGDYTPAFMPEAFYDKIQYFSDALKKMTEPKEKKEEESTISMQTLLETNRALVDVILSKEGNSVIQKWNKDNTSSSVFSPF